MGKRAVAEAPTTRVPRRVSPTSLGTRTVVHSESVASSCYTKCVIADADGTIPIALPKLSSPHAAAPTVGEEPSTGLLSPVSQPAKRSRFQEVRKSLWPAPTGSSLPLDAHGLDKVPLTPTRPVEKTLARSKTRRKTLLERIEGWWDLGLVRMDTVRGKTKAFPVGRKDSTAEEFV